MRNAAIGIIFNREKTEILLLLRRDVPIWVFPGGGIDDGETPEQAVVRELFEETNLHVKIKRKIGEYTPINRLSSGTHVFECVPVGGVPSSGVETKKVAYYPLDQLPEPFFPLHEEWLKDALEGAPYIIKKPINISYWDIFKYFFSHPFLMLRALSSRLGYSINN